MMAGMNAGVNRLAVLAALVAAGWVLVWAFPQVMALDVRGPAWWLAAGYAAAAAAAAAGLVHGVAWVVRGFAADRAAGRGRDGR
jgi:hypothetical protein